MLFKRYEEISLRLEQLGAQMGNLSNGDRQELQSLLEEQAWLSSTLVKQAKSLLEEIDNSFERLFDWMIYISDLIEQASGRGGTTGDILRLKMVMVEAENLKEQLKRLTFNNESGPSNEITVVPQPVLETRMEAAPALVPVEIEQPSAVPPVMVVPVKRKVRKKKVKKTGEDTGTKGKYSPPRELLAALAEKMAPSKRHHAGALGNVSIPGSDAVILPRYALDHNIKMIKVQKNPGLLK
ncbi:hypothetical protein IT084_13545 [Desulfallas sp. Bu1-1]|uniref:hypothetical protein n=1 Tax=Desulfallas sp. Bu1-1 TaxID=2787620 RepID=UPI0018A0501F|nr:hypothetical protein [Desulfallas sp. Bu1-1]MBF7083992.1 hypothetical protein [Desulfallas sp. Bu1-1]